MEAEREEWWEAGALPGLRGHLPFLRTGAHTPCTAASAPELLVQGGSGSERSRSWDVFLAVAHGSEALRHDRGCEKKKRTSLPLSF